ncbi:MAG TPA: NAD(P)/FAD-dependent oxidoreductase [Polyangiaceae bacterium]|jgi:2-polyprenyl-6-methoxyphenol hydroxylase-like FAD-dependent oxidoreductase
MEERLDVAVIGCGTAGAASALFLSRAGHRVTLFERVPEPGPVGAGIMMQPSGLLVLERLGLAAQVLQRGARVERLSCETTGGRMLLDLAYGDLGEGLFGVGLHRGVLFETLHAAVKGSAVDLRCGVAIERLRRAPDRDRLLVEEEAGAPRGPFDLVVVCDGARSRVRDSLPSVARTVRPYPWGALWFIGRDPALRYTGRLHQVVRGARRMIGLLPTGLGPGGAQAPLVSLFASVRADAVEAVRARGLEAWKDDVLSVAPHAAPVLDQIASFEQLTFAAYFDVTMPRWHAHRVVFLGDAAHATSPQLGQGCNLALVDAADLADALQASRSLPAALERYTATRRDHLAYYQLATRWLTPFFQSDDDWLGVLRDLALGPACAVPFVRREMVRSMAGTKTGLLFGSRPTRMPA